MLTELEKFPQAVSTPTIFPHQTTDTISLMTASPTDAAETTPTCQDNEHLKKDKCKCSKRLIIIIIII